MPRFNTDAVNASEPQATVFEAIVIGAGFAGLYQLHLLGELGYVVKVIEAGVGVGGT